MTGAAQGIVGKATFYKGSIRKMIIVTVVNDTHEPMPNLKFKVTFKDGQSINIQSNSEGKLIIPMRTKGKLKFELLEDAIS